MAKQIKKHRRLKRAIWLVVLLALAAGAFYLFVWPQLTAEATVTYDTYSASRGTISNSLSFSGSVALINSETLTASSEATVRKVYVTETQQVQSGDKLLRLSNGETVKANFDGTVNVISVEEGDTVSMNASLIQIVDFAHMQVTMRVDEYQISDVKVGQTCKIKVTALDDTFDSTVTHINKVSSSQGSTAYYTVTCTLTVTEDVLPGMAVTVTIPQEEAVDAVILNKSALSFSNENSAYVLMKQEDGTMQQTEITIGVDNDNYVEVVSGLSEGDTVYVQAKSSSSSSSGLSSILSLLGGGTSAQPSTGTMPSSMGSGNWSGGNTDRSNRQNFGGGSMPSGGGMMP